MSKAAIHDQTYAPETGFLNVEDTYRVEVENPDEVRQLQAYALKNEDTTFLVDFQFEGVMRGQLASLDHLENYPEANNLIGGGSEPIDRNSYGIIISGACYQNFREELYGQLLRSQFDSGSETDLVLPLREDGEHAKDIYAARGYEIDEFPKAVRTAARVGEGPELPNLYGVVWREGTNESLKDIFEEEENVTVGFSEFDKYSQPLEEDLAETFWNNLTEHAQHKEPGELVQSERLNAKKYENSGKERTPLNCAAEIGRETTNKRTPNYPVGDLKSRTDKTS